jgi:hypothetical protein
MNANLVSKSSPDGCLAEATSLYPRPVMASRAWHCLTIEKYAFCIKYTTALIVVTTSWALQR